MDRKELLLTIVMEECGELTQRISKAVRFGLDEVQEGQDLSNAERIVYEFNDLLATLGVLEDEGYLDNIIDLSAIDKKKLKIEKYLCYSKELGIG